MGAEQVVLVPARGGTGGLRHRLRAETAGLHDAVERAVDLPRSVGSRADYVDLLTRLHGFHTAAEVQLARPAWRSSWSDLGIELGRHERSPLLAEDLRRLDAPVEGPSPGGGGPLPGPARFGEALGCLYVLEGSSLGGRVLGPAVRQTLGAVPTAFFDSDGRQHPSPWRAVQEALRRYETVPTAADDTAGDDVLAGARATFVAFGRHLAGDRFVAEPAL